MAFRVSSNRAVSKHKASDLNEFLTEELTGMIVEVDAERFLQFALPEASWDTSKWKEVTDKIKADNNHPELKQAWIAATPETSKYKPFCDWVEALLTFIHSCTLPQQRQIHFTPLGSTNIDCTPGYADGEVVSGTSSYFKPDAACVMREARKATELGEATELWEATEFKGWWQVLVPIEFKRRDRGQRSKGATPSASTSDLKGLKSSNKRSASQREDSTSESHPKKFCGGLTQSSSSQRPPTSNRSDDSTSESSPKNVRRERLVHRVKQCKPEPATESATASPTFFHCTATQDDIQLARYAMETLAAVGDRTHVFGLAVNSDNAQTTRPHTITLWYFDRCGAIRSHPLDVNKSEDLDAFIKFLAALVCMKDDALGFNPFFADPTNPGPRKELRKELCEISVYTPQNQPLRLGKVLDRRTGMVGRATLVYRARLRVEGSTPEEDDVVLKSSWQHRIRTPESKILEELQAHDQDHTYIVKCYAGWEQEDTGGNSQRAKFDLGGIGVHDRVLRHTVLEYLNPITKLSQPFHVLHIGWSILLAIEFLNEQGWYHRDISIGNMGFVILPCNGVLVKLHDFDLSKQRLAPQNAPHWTGTLPFMAIGLLEAPESDHWIGFDVEALIWTLLWITRVYERGEALNVPLGEHPLMNWFCHNGDLSALGPTKRGYLQDEPQHPWANDFYQEISLEMQQLAWEWHMMLGKQTQERHQRTIKNRKNGDSNEDGRRPYISEKVYGEKGFDDIKGWMKENGWSKPRELCNCLEDHCAEKVGQPCNRSK